MCTFAKYLFFPDVAGGDETEIHVRSSDGSKPPVWPLSVENCGGKRARASSRGQVEIAIHLSSVYSTKHNTLFWICIDPIACRCVHRGLITQPPAIDSPKWFSRGAATSALSSRKITVLTCLLFLSFFLCALYALVFFPDSLGLWYALPRCPFNASPWVPVLVWDFGGAPV